MKNVYIIKTAKLFAATVMVVIGCLVVPIKGPIAEFTVTPSLQLDVPYASAVSETNMETGITIFYEALEGGRVALQTGGEEPDASEENGYCGAGALADYGYVFIGWVNDNEEYLSEEDVYLPLTETADTRIFAVFEKMEASEEAIAWEREEKEEAAVTYVRRYVKGDAAEEEPPAEEAVEEQLKDGQAEEHAADGQAEIEGAEEERTEKEQAKETQTKEEPTEEAQTEKEQIEDERTEKEQTKEAQTEEEVAEEEHAEEALTENGQPEIEEDWEDQAGESAVDPLSENDEDRNLPQKSEGEPFMEEALAEEKQKTLAEEKQEVLSEEKQESLAEELPENYAKAIPENLAEELPDPPLTESVDIASLPAEEVIRIAAPEEEKADEPEEQPPKEDPDVMLNVLCVDAASDEVLAEVRQDSVVTGQEITLSESIKDHYEVDSVGIFSYISGDAYTNRVSPMFYKSQKSVVSIDTATLTSVIDEQPEEDITVVYYVSPVQTPLANMRLLSTGQIEQPVNTGIGVDWKLPIILSAWWYGCVKALSVVKRRTPKEGIKHGAGNESR